MIFCHSFQQVNHAPTKTAKLSGQPLFHAFSDKLDALKLNGPEQIYWYPRNGQASLPFVHLKQIHSTIVHYIDGELLNLSHLRPDQAHKMTVLEGDGLLCQTPGLGLAVKVADCAPLLLFHPDGPWIAALHSGWRGTAQNILQKALLHPKVQNLDRKKWKLLIGPCIQACCYEVRDDVASAFQAYPQFLKKNTELSYQLDLSGVIEAQAYDLGLQELERVALCTSCQKDLFNSFRRDKKLQAHQYGLIALNPAVS